MFLKKLFGLDSPASPARPSSDPRLNAQGYVHSGRGIISRFQRSSAYWEPHLRSNKSHLLQIAEKLKQESVAPRGTLLVLGAGRLLDIPYPELFPCFERVVLFDADGSCGDEQKKLLAAAGLPPAQFVHCDLTDAVVEHAALAKEMILSADGPQNAAESLRLHFQNLPAPVPSWTRTYADVRLVTSSNLLSQLGHYPRQHTQNQFRERFQKELTAFQRASEALESFLGRVRANHVAGLASFPKAWAFFSGDYRVATYELSGRSTMPAPPQANGTDIDVDENGIEVFRFPVRYTEHSDPLFGQKVSQLWPPGTPLEGPHRWAWHIIPQGSEPKNMKYGRVHLVEAWVKRPL